MIHSDSLWGERIAVVRSVGIPYQWQALNDAIPGASPSHAVQNIRTAAGRATGPFYGAVCQDSDVAKWLEAVSYQLAVQPDPDLESAADEVIELIAEAQDSNGYFNTYFALTDPSQRWTNLTYMHELYCAGHLIEAAVAYYEATGKETLLDVATKLAGHIDSVFGTEPGKKRGYPGHEEIELALVKLYRSTGEERYLRLAKYFIDERGKQPHYFRMEEESRDGAPMPWWIIDPSYRYWQAHLPVREQTTAEGHAVRAVYLYSGMADVALETDDEDLYEVCRRLWENVVNRRMYITGAVGSSCHGEAFTFDYDLPNDTAYAETCASIGLAMWAGRMLQGDLDSRYADVLERALYNTVLSGMSLDGTRYFYVNPLEVWPEACNRRLNKCHVKYERQPWFQCACCPPNILRMISSIGSYAYSHGKDEICVHLFVAGRASLRIDDQDVVVAQKTRYPDTEDVSIEVSPQREAEFSLLVRIPGWCEGAELRVNGILQDISELACSGYARIRRRWSRGDTVDLVFPMPVRRVRAHPAVRSCSGKVALQRGPIVYCLEQVDNGPNLSAISLRADSKLTSHFDSELMGGTVVISGNAVRDDESAWSDGLYLSGHTPAKKPVTIRAIPYRKWANRRAGEMLVWIREALD
jgi:DUF1680 family protein